MPAGSTYTPIATTTANGSISTYTFTSIPSTYTDLVLVCNTSTAASYNLNVLVGNGSIDSGANYSDTYLIGDGSSATSGRHSNANAIQTSYSNANALGNQIIQFFNYANTTTYKTIISRASQAGTNASAYVGLWRSTSAINQIQVLATGSNNFTAGSTFTLYGIASA